MPIFKPFVTFKHALRRQILSRSGVFCALLGSVLLCRGESEAFLFYRVLSVKVSIK